jgi:teichuronic acid biosynthesis glycosyltransferase TuaG
MSSTTVTVSVLMPAYNAARTLKESVQSVQQQTLPDWELLLVVDRKSCDDTRAIAQALAAEDERIRLITDLPYGGCSYNRNFAMTQARGEFLAFLDSDDLWLPEKLARQTAFMQAVQCDLSYTGYAQMDWQGRPLARTITPPARLAYDDLLNENLLGCLTAMIRRSRFPAFEFPDHLHEDFIIWLRMLRETVAQGLPETLAVYRVAASSRSGNKIRAAAARWRILRKFEHLPLRRAAPAFARYIYRSLRKRTNRGNSV